MDSTPTGIAQIQWALAFLRTVVNGEGDHSQDVEVCIEALEEILIEKYAELSKEIDAVNKLDQTVHYASGAFGSSTMITKEMPFSLNYAEIKEKNAGRQQADAQQTKSITSTEAEEELERIKKAAGVQSIDELEPVAKDKAINILKMWKTDQVEKIKEELKRLREIEDRMKDIDDNFAGYVQDDIQVLVE